MKKNNRQDMKSTVESLLRLHGRTFAEEIGIPLKKNGAARAALFRLLYSSMLFSTRINSATAVRASRTLSQRGWDVPEKMAHVPWADKVKTLDEAHYVRYDEGTAVRLEEMARQVIDRYGGDIENLRRKAGNDPAEERVLLEEFKGIGEVGANIFFREVQGIWDENYPFADDRALKAARRLGLPGDAKALARLVSKRSFPRLVAALIRTDLAKDYGRVCNA